MTGNSRPGFFQQEFHPVIAIGEQYKVLDLTKGFDPTAISLDPPSIGRYNEKRPNMYNAELFDGKRDIHMGLDFWVPPGTPVHAFAGGTVLFLRDNDNPGDYGPTIVTQHSVGDVILYALFGHLNCASLDHVRTGMLLHRGDVFAEVGNESENGGWIPHLHFQLSWIRPDQPDMPGVVSGEEHSDALKRYPDPQLVTGRFY